MEVRVWTCLLIVDNDSLVIVMDVRWPLLWMFIGRCCGCLLVVIVDVCWSLLWMFVGRCCGCSLVIIIGAHSGYNGGDITVTCNE